MAIDWKNYKGPMSMAELCPDPKNWIKSCSYCRSKIVDGQEYCRCGRKLTRLDFEPREPMDRVYGLKYNFDGMQVEHGTMA